MEKEEAKQILIETLMPELQDDYSFQWREVQLNAQQRHKMFKGLKLVNAFNLFGITCLHYDEENTGRYYIACIFSNDEVLILQLNPKHALKYYR